MFTGFVSYSSKANLGKKNHELEYENCQKQAYNLDFSSLPQKFRILHYYNTMQAGMGTFKNIALAEDEKIFLFIVKSTFINLKFRI